jgi:hypothetical protein
MSRTERISSRRRVLLALAMLTAAIGPTLTVNAPAAAAAPRRTDSATKPVYFIHGFDQSVRGTGHNCSSYWSKAMAGFRKGGWTGKLITFGYYKTDRGCTVEYPGTRSTSLKTVGKALAWDIYRRYSRHGTAVDVTAHSTGGLVIRSALTQVQKKAKGWPPYLYVEDVATLGTPHAGTVWARTCTPQQCKDMRPRSAFLKSLYESPQSAQGTDWTLIGSDFDVVVKTSSALAMKAGHKVKYARGQRITHGALANKASGSYRMQHWNYYAKGWSSWHRGASPIIVAKNADYWWWRW